jgi:hypothetical protein
VLRRFRSGSAPRAGQERIGTLTPNRQPSSAVNIEKGACPHTVGSLSTVLVTLVMDVALEDEAEKPYVSAAAS